MQLCKNGLHDKDLPGARCPNGQCRECWRVTHIRAKARYNASDAGQATQALYSASPKRRAAKALYDASEAGLATRSHYKSTAAGQLAVIRGEANRRGSR